MSATNVATEVGGGETFILGLVSSLAQMEGVQCAVLVPKERQDELSAHLPTNVELLPVASRSGALRVGRDAIGLERIIRRWRAEVFHYPHEWAPRAPCPTVLTIQNVAFVHPETENAFGIRGRLLRGLMARTAYRASAVGAVSSSAARLWVQATGYSRPVFIIPEGFAPTELLVSETDPEPYCVLVTGPYAYKNTRLGIEAFKRARAAGLNLHLRVVGVGGLDEFGIRFCGWLDRPELLGMIERATLTLFPSSVESFGLPALESVALGTPCIFLRDTPMEEWLGTQGVAVDRDAASLAAALLKLAKAPSRAGPLPSGRFDWESIASDWVTVYRAAAS